MVGLEKRIQAELEAGIGARLAVSVVRTPLPIGRLTRAETAVARGRGAGGRQREYRRGRAALRRLSARVAGFRMSRTFPDPRVSLSHSGGWAIAVRSCEPLAFGAGVDLELCAVDPDAVRFYLTAEEREVLAVASRAAWRRRRCGR